jgi:hypothetical protein
MPVAHLEDRAVLALTGPEARPFLQGLITNDIERLEPGKGIYAALLTPQGKVLFDFFLVEGDGAILLDCLAASRDALLKRLSMYRLRSKIMIEARDQLAVLAEWGGAAVRSAISYSDPRLAELGRRAIIATGEMRADLMAAEDYHAHRMACGVPEGADFGSDRMFALDANLEELHAVDFDKGCYVGQELTARMKHRGMSRKRLLAIAADAGALPKAGATVKAGGEDIGEIVAGGRQSGFALIRLDRLARFGAAHLTSGETPVKLSKPSWLFP